MPVIIVPSIEEEEYRNNMPATYWLLNGMPFTMLNTFKTSHGSGMWGR